MGFEPKVSIIIAVYNGSNYLREAIDSALAQTYNNIEILVINDGSTDGGKTERIAKDYGDKIRYFHKENGGVASALNLGITEMTGEYFSWLSHDDLYFPSKIEKQIAFLKTNQEAKVVGSNVQIIDSSGAIIEEYRNTLHPVIRNGRDAMETWIYGCGLLIHRSCFDRAGLFNIANKTTQDVEMWQKIVKHYHIYFVHDILSKNRIHSAMGSRTSGKLHTSDREYYIKWVLDNFDISWYFPSDIDASIQNTRRLRSQTYNWLGDHAWSAIGAPNAARLCYLKAFIENPLFFSTLLKAALGKNLFLKMSSLLK